jgi:hypothetical protein
LVVVLVSTFTIPGLMVMNAMYAGTARKAG